MLSVHENISKETGLPVSDMLEAENQALKDIIEDMKISKNLMEIQLQSQCEKIAYLQRYISYSRN